MPVLRRWVKAHTEFVAAEERIMKNVSFEGGVGWVGQGRWVARDCWGSGRLLEMTLPLRMLLPLQHPGFKAAESVYKTRWMPPARPFGMWGEA